MVPREFIFFYYFGAATVIVGMNTGGGFVVRIERINEMRGSGLRVVRCEESVIRSKSEG